MAGLNRANQRWIDFLRSTTLRTDKIPNEREGVEESGHNIREQTQERTFSRL